MGETAHEINSSKYPHYAVCRVEEAGPRLTEDVWPRMISRSLKLIGPDTKTSLRGTFVEDFF